MNAMGHNESAIRLAALAGDAQIALDKVAKGEADAIEGWLAYGAALNEGRSLFKSDEQFGEWIVSSNLRLSENDKMERAAAMWAAANADQLAEAKATCKARTLRGWHDQWKKIEQEREKARQKAEREARKREEAETARKAVEAQDKVEKEARAVAAAATTDDERQEAEGKAEQAAEAKAEAEKAVVAAEAEIKEPEIDPETVKVMRELAKMTPEGVAEEVAGLRAVAAERKAEIAALKREIADLKDENKAMRESEGGRSLGNALRKANAAEGRMREHQAIAARLQRQVNAQKDEIARLRKEIESQVIPL